MKTALTTRSTFGNISLPDYSYYYPAEYETIDYRKPERTLSERVNFGGYSGWENEGKGQNIISFIEYATLKSREGSPIPRSHAIKVHFWQTLLGRMSNQICQEWTKPGTGKQLLRKGLKPDNGRVSWNKMEAIMAVPICCGLWLQCAQRATVRRFSYNQGPFWRLGYFSYMAKMIFLHIRTTYLT